MRRIGILGGTFNPIHNGHLAIAEAARTQFGLEKVLFLPSGIPYMKDQKEVLPADIRCEMTALAIADCPYFELSRLEASDSALGKNSYTFETLQKLRQNDRTADYYFILGADSLYAIEKWKNPASIFANCTLLAAVRTQDTHISPKSQQALSDRTKKRSESDKDRTSRHDRLLHQVRYLRKKYCASVEILEFAGMDISSTQIRRQLRRGETVSGLIPAAVEDYILKHECYR